jgi:hypothetical protein
MSPKNQWELIDALEAIIHDPGFPEAFRHVVETKNTVEKELFEQLFPEYYNALQEYQQQEAYAEELDDRE